MMHTNSEPFCPKLNHSKLDTLQHAATHWNEVICGLVWKRVGTNWGVLIIMIVFFETD